MYTYGAKLRLWYSHYWNHCHNLICNVCIYLKRGSVWLCSARWHHVHNSRMYMYIKVVMTCIHGQMSALNVVIDCKALLAAVSFLMLQVKNSTDCFLKCGLFCYFTLHSECAAVIEVLLLPVSCSGLFIVRFTSVQSSLEKVEVDKH